MTRIVSHPEFLLRRTADEQHKAATALQTLARRASQWRDQIGASCDEARAILTDALDRTTTTVAAARESRQRSLAALESGNMAALIEERDRLAASLARPAAAHPTRAVAQECPRIGSRK